MFDQHQIFIVAHNCCNEILSEIPQNKFELILAANKVLVPCHFENESGFCIIKTSLIRLIFVA